jgi:amino acid transporter
MKDGIGLGGCVAILIGGMIGSAIFSLSGLTIYEAGPAAILSWGIAGAVMLGYGLIAAELSTFFPKSGGVFVFPAKALGKTPAQGRLWGWISTWGYLNANIAATAFSAIYVATYLGVGFPVFAGLQVPLAVAAVLVCGILNCVRFTTLGRANGILTIALVATLAAFIVLAFRSGDWDGALLTPFFTQGAKGGTGFLQAVPVAMVAYGSIVSIAFMVSEVRTPNKNVPRSVVIALACVAVLYCLTILAVVGLVSAQFLADNPGMRYIPLYAASFTKLSAYPWIAKLISISAVLALVTTIVIIIALTSRTLQAAAESGLLPRVLGKNAKNGSPVNATVIILVLSAAMSCFPQFTSFMANSGALFSAITISINCVSLFAARRKFTLAPGAFRAPCGPVFPVFTLGVLLLCYIPGAVTGGWRLWAYTVAWYLLGLGVYFLTAKRAKDATV